MGTGRQHAVGTIADMAQMGEILGHHVERRRDDAMLGKGRDGLFELMRLQAVVGIEDGGIRCGDLLQRDIAGIGGAAAFAIGSVFLMDTDLPAFQIAWQVIAAVTLVSVLVMTIILRLALRARRHKVVTGPEGMVGSAAEAMEDFTETGRVRAHGEIWRARCTSPVHQGDRLRILAVDGLTLHVETDS